MSRDATDQATRDMFAQQRAQGRLNRAVAASGNFRGLAYVQARDRASCVLLALLDAYAAGQANQVAQILEDSQQLADELRQLGGGQVLRA